MMNRLKIIQLIVIGGLLLTGCHHNAPNILWNNPSQDRSSISPNHNMNHDTERSLQNDDNHQVSDQTDEQINERDEQESENIVLESSHDDSSPSLNAQILINEPMNDLHENQISQIKPFIEKHIHTFDQTLSARLGLMIVSLADQSTIIAHNENECFIPASLTKLVVSSALFKMLTDFSDQDPDLAFQTLSSQVLSQPDPTFSTLSQVLTHMNHYTFSQAPRANQMADRLGNYLRQVHHWQTSDMVTLEQLLLSHIDIISFIEACNRIEKASGLSVHNKLTPAQVAACMVHLKTYPVFVNSLIQPGQGTLSHRLLELQNTHVFKTGSLRQTGVLCLAGYLSQPIDLCFVIMINQLNPVFFDEGVQWMDDLVRMIVK